MKETCVYTVFCTPSRPAVVPTQYPIQCVPAAVPLGVKATRAASWTLNYV